MNTPNFLLRSLWRQIFRDWVPPLLLCSVFWIFVLHGFGGTFPPGLNHDAAWHGLYAFRILNGVPFSVYIPESYGHETPYYYVMAGLFALRGASKEGIELTAMLFGSLSLVLFYRLMARKSGQPWVALACSCLWASSSALILYSRVGWQLVTLLPAALGVCASCRSYLDYARFRAQSRLWAAAIGLSAAITLYTYNGGRAILGFLPAFWLLRALQVWIERPKQLKEGVTVRSTALDGALSLGVFLVVCAPMLHYAAFNWQEWNGRASSLMGNSGGVAGKMSNLLASFGYFNFSARGDDFFTDFPVLEGPMLGLWLVGMLFAIFRFRTYWPELLLFGTFLLPGIVTKPSFHRAIGTLPIVYVLACYFLLALGHQMQGRWGQKRGAQVFAATLAIVVGLQMSAGWKKLYVEKQPFAWGFYPETTVVGRYLHANPTQKFVIHANNWPQDALTFLATTDKSRPGANFVNYQSYNTPSGDGLPEIMRDLESGLIARPANLVVDPPKVEALMKSLKAIYRVEDKGELKYQGSPIAQLLVIK